MNPTTFTLPTQQFWQPSSGGGLSGLSASTSAASVNTSNPFQLPSFQNSGMSGTGNSGGGQMSLQQILGSLIQLFQMLLNPSGGAPNTAFNGDQSGNSSQGSADSSQTHHHHHSSSGSSGSNGSGGSGNAGGSGGSGNAGGSGGSGKAGGSSSSSGTSGSVGSAGPVSPPGPLNKVNGEWWWPYEGGPTISEVMQQAPQVNYLSLAGAFSSTSGGGTVNDSILAGRYGSEDAAAADIKAWTDSGRTAVGMVGGEGDKTTINNQQEADQFLQSAIPIIQKLGLQGVDFDLENSPNPQALAYTIEKLKDTFGPNFKIAISPRPYEMRDGGVYRQAIQQLQQDGRLNDIDYIQPQDYALNGDSLSGQKSYMDSDLNDWINNLGIPASKIIIGSYSGAGEPESAATAAATYSNYQSLGIGGGINWQTGADAQQGWAFANQLAAAESGG